MELCNSPDIFQEIMNELFNGLEYVGTYIDDLLIISNGNFEEHQNEIKIVLKELKAVGFKINTIKSFLARDDLEYLGFKKSRQGIMSLPDEVQAIKNISVPTNKSNLKAL